MRKNPQIFNNSFPPFPRFFLDSTSIPILYLLPRAAQGDRECGFRPQGSVLQQQTTSAWVPHGVTSPASKPAPARAPLSTGPEVLAGACSSTDFPCGHSLLRASICSSMGSFPACRWISAPLWSSMGFRGTTCLTMSLLHRLQGNLCSSDWSTSSPSFFTDLGVCRVVSLTSSHSSLSTTVSSQVFFPLLKYVIPEVLPPLLMGSALASGAFVLEPAGTGFIKHGGSFSQLLTEATPIAPLLPKSCHANS